MTSSLVGSEMCIRDSHLFRDIANLAKPSILVLCYLNRLMMPWKACCQEAVSYTHLTLPTICSV
eukprot:5411024-Prorocentrum_lima.AAC.1